VSDGRISSIVSEPQTANHTETQFLLPGLADMHVHLPPDNSLRLTPYIALLYLSHGVTSLREAGDINGTAVAAALAGIKTDAFPCPQVFYCGPFVAAGKQMFRNTIILSEPEDAKAAVERVR